MKKKPFLIIFIVFFFVQIALAGNEINNGGDAVVDEFVLICRKLAKKSIDNFIKQHSVPFSKEEFEAGCNTNKTIILSTTEPLFIKSKISKELIPKDAINNPDSRKITIQRFRWLGLPMRMKVRLTAHEIFGLIKVKDNDYYWTDLLINSNTNVTQVSGVNKLQSESKKSWLLKVQVTLKSGLEVGFYSKTRAKEYEALASSIYEVFSLQNQFWQESYLIYLYGGVIDIEFIKKKDSKIRILKQMIRFTLEEISRASYESIDTQLNKLIHRIPNLGIQMHTLIEELIVLKRASYMAMAIIERSGRSKDYQGELKILTRINDIADSELLSGQKVLLIRSEYRKLLRD